MDKLSIVTIVYNDRKNIKSTIESVLNQTYEDIEFIVIDGDSNDGTQDIIKAHIDRISYYISEPDNGIYDAMNKAINIASGDWLIFMNSGDIFYNNNVLESIFSNPPDADIIYGNHAPKDDTAKIITPRRLNTFWKGLPFNHQSSLVRTHLYKEHKFDTKYTISSVHDFFYKLYKNDCKFKYIDITVAIYDFNGISATSFLWLLDNFRINLKYKEKSIFIVTLYLMRIGASRLKSKILKK